MGSCDGEEVRHVPVRWATCCSVHEAFTNKTVLFCTFLLKFQNELFQFWKFGVVAPLPAATILFLSFISLEHVTIEFNFINVA